MTQAVCSTISRYCSSSIHESAIIACTACLSASRSPWVRRDSARSHIMSKARRHTPTVRIAWCTRPPPSRACATLKPCPGPPSIASAGTRTLRYLM